MTPTTKDFEPPVVPVASNSLEFTDDRVATTGALFLPEVAVHAAAAFVSDTPDAPCDGVSAKVPLLTLKTPPHPAISAENTGNRGDRAPSQTSNTATTDSTSGNKGPQTSGSVPHGHCHCGCGQRTTLAQANDRSSGRVKGEPNRFVAGHGARKGVAPDCGYVVDPTTGCWVWMRAKTWGYGLKTVNGKLINAHIAHWVERHGPVPPDLELDHVCRNRACCNPDHLEAVSPRVNVQRGDKTKLTADDVAAIRASSEGRRVLATRYGVAPTHIYAIKTFRTWVPEGMATPSRRSPSLRGER